jgi:ABC-2 type transport system ATP-binding protein
MAAPTIQAEVLDIEGAKKGIRADLTTGDFTKQKLACERLLALSDNHFPHLLIGSVTLVSDANRLDDRIRERRITALEQRAEINDLLASAIKLIIEMDRVLPVGRIVTDGIKPEEKAEVEARSKKLTEEIARREDSEERHLEDQSTDDEGDILRFIVRERDPHSQGKLIIAQDLTKTYRGSPFRLRPISLELDRGEILGIVGVNASGKTTLLRILLGEIKQSAGDLHYPSFENSTKKRDWLSIKRRIGYVSQVLPQWPGKVYDNLCYVASIYGHSLNDISIFLDLLLKRYGLDKFRQSTWREISGGYRTRFEIARALVSAPDILILDEPLAYLDILSQQIVLRQIRQLVKNRVKPIGVIITSQQLYEIESVADRLLVLDGGNILFSDRIRSLSKLSDDLVVEFNSNGDMQKMKMTLMNKPHYVTLFATETGYIAVFKRTVSGETILDFNGVLKILGQECPGRLSYARDISSSCRRLFEPRLVELTGLGGPK